MQKGSAVLEQVPKGIVGSPSQEDFKMCQDNAKAEDWQQLSFLG